VHPRPRAQAARPSPVRTALGRAVVARAHPGRRALSSERAYTLGVLPHAFARALADAATGHDRLALARAGAIAGGLMVTTAGYIAGAGRRVGWGA
jgi:hypothetical protein